MIFFKQLLIQNGLIFMLYLDRIYTKQINTRRYNDLLSAHQMACFDVEKATIYNLKER